MKEEVGFGQNMTKKTITMGMARAIWKRVEWQAMKLCGCAAGS